MTIFLLHFIAAIFNLSYVVNMLWYNTGSSFVFWTFVLCVIVNSTISVLAVKNG